MCRPLSILSTGWLLGIVTICAPCRAADDAATSADELPRYRLEVGQEITYESASEFNYTGGSLITQTKWQIWVVARNDDGSWRLILHKTDQSFRGGSPRTTFAYCDLFPDGRMTSNATLGFKLDPAELIVGLPKSEDELRNGWQVVNQTTSVTRVHRLLSELDSSPVAIEVERESPMDEIYESTSRSAVHFDRGRGLVERIETESTQGYGFDGKGTGLTELVSVETKDKEWSEALRQDADRYLEANQKYLELFKQARREPEGTDQLLADAVALLSSVREGTSSSIVRKQLDRQIKDHASTADYARQRADVRSQFVGQPSPEWETTDFQGNAHSLEGYRGKRRHSRLLVPRLRLVHPRDAASQTNRRLFRGSRRRCLRDEHGPQGRRRALRDRENGAELSQFEGDGHT